MGEHAPPPNQPSTPWIWWCLVRAMVLQHTHKSAPTAARCARRWRTRRSRHWGWGGLRVWVSMPHHQISHPHLGYGGVWSEPWFCSTHTSQPPHRGALRAPLAHATEPALGVGRAEGMGEHAPPPNQPSTPWIWWCLVRAMVLQHTHKSAPTAARCAPPLAHATEPALGVGRAEGMGEHAPPPNQPSTPWIWWCLVRAMVLQHTHKSAPHRGALRAPLAHATEPALGVGRAEGMGEHAPPPNQPSTPWIWWCLVRAMVLQHTHKSAPHRGALRAPLAHATEPALGVGRAEGMGEHAPPPNQPSTPWIWWCLVRAMVLQHTHKSAPTAARCARRWRTRRSRHWGWGGLRVWVSMPHHQISHPHLGYGGVWSEPWFCSTHTSQPPTAARCARRWRTRRSRHWGWGGLRVWVSMPHHQISHPHLGYGGVWSEPWFCSTHTSQPPPRRAARAAGARDGAGIGGGEG